MRPQKGLRKGLLPFFFEHRVQFSLFFFIPVFLILFSLVPAYLAVLILSRAFLSPGRSGKTADFTPVLDAITQVSWIYYGSGLFALAAGLAIAYSLVQPVRRLKTAFQDVPAEIHKANLHLEASGEFAHLGDEFNRMVSRLDLREKLHRTERLAALGTLAAGVAHEVRNPLGAVRGLAQLLRESTASPQEKIYSEKIMKEVDRLNHSVEGFLELARPKVPGRVRKLDLNRLVHEAVELSGYDRNNKRIEIQEEYDPRLPEFQMDGEAMRQAVLNLLLNAVQAIPESGTIRVKTGLRPHSENPENSRAAVEIVNTGPEIPKENLRRIFDPFFTTKEKGTGLGLPITDQIVTAQGGAIHVETGNNETTFRIELPVK